jgi:hypothetical protein
MSSQYFGAGALKKISTSKEGIEGIPVNNSINSIG